MTNGSMATTVSPSDAIYKNQVVTVQTTVTVSATNTAPSSITFRLRDPSGNTDTYSSSQLTVVSTAVFSIDVTGDEEGIFYWYFHSTGTAQAAAYGQFTVMDTLFN